MIIKGKLGCRVIVCAGKTPEHFKWKIMKILSSVLDKHEDENGGSEAN